MSKRFPYLMASLAALALIAAPSHAFAAASEMKSHQAEHATACGCAKGAASPSTVGAASRTTSAEELQRIWTSP
jgi:hypothetical protein